MEYRESDVFGVSVSVEWQAGALGGYMLSGCISQPQTKAEIW